MEEVLNGVLECPVCLEKMDASCRVLPCQHTFHAECLHSVSRASSSAECPECRSHWHGNVDDLPPNVLLMRLLEEMQRQGSDCSSHSDSNELLPDDDGILPVEDDILEPVIDHPSQELLYGLFDQESLARREINKSSRRRLNKGKRLKHQADQERDAVLQCLLYVKSALCFLAASSCFEDDVLLVFLTKVLSLLRLRLQASLYRRMFECVEKEVVRSQKTLQNFHRGYCTKKKLLGSGTVVSENIYSVFVLQNLCFSYLYNWRSQWKKADRMLLQNPEVQRLLSLVDQQCTALTINSSLGEAVRYVGTTVRILNAAHTRRNKKRPPGYSTTV